MTCKFLSSVGSAMLIIGLALVMVCRFTGSLGVAALAFLLIFAGLGVIHLADRVRRQENEKTPITTVEATVVGHRKETYHSRYRTSHSFYITFKPKEGGDALEFKVSEAEYQDFGVGDEGPLRYRTWEYLSFCAKDMSEVEPLSRLPEEYDPDVKEAAEESRWDQAEKLLDMATEKAGALWQKAKERIGTLLVNAKPVHKDEASEQEDGILTHELDE